MKRSGVRTVLEPTWGSGHRSNRRQMEFFSRSQPAHIANLLKEHSAPKDFRSEPGVCPQSRWRPRRPRARAHAHSFAPSSSGPADRHPSHSPAAALCASPASPLSGGPLLTRFPSPEVDVAAWQRRRGGGRSASGETGPGLVFVNLPRSRRG